jgi:ubiquinone/menaquinone biosynthesis C-methylase UbiE
MRNINKKRVGFRESRISPEYYFEWRKNRGYSCVEKVNKRIPFKNKKILDIGCGYGALSSILLEKGACVWGTEIDKAKLQFTQKKLSNNNNFKSFLVQNEILHFDNDFFDIVFLFDVIEHVKNPLKTMHEVSRVLKPGGYLYVEFTPYYSITGHHLYDYAKWPIHLLPKEKIKQIVFSKKVNSYMTQDYYWKQFESLNKLKINDFQQIVSGFEKIEEKFIIKFPEIFEINIPLINYLGPLKDFFTMSFEGLYRKKLNFTY